MDKNLERKRVVDKRTIKLEDLLKPDYIPFLSGRPERETIINDDDLMNLEIMVNTTNSVEDFVQKI
jgi:hypothetical protein